MGHFITTTGNKTIEGDLSLPTGALMPEQKAAAAMGQEYYQIISDPFLLIKIIYNPNNTVPYELTHMSPSYYSQFTFDQEDFVRLVLDRDLHRQDAYKLVYIQDGELYQRVESQRHKYSTGSCFLMNRNVRHNEEYLSSFSLTSLFLSEEIFHELITENDEKYFKTQHLWNKETELYHFFENVISQEQLEGKKYIDFIPKTVLASGDNPVQSLFDELAHIVMNPFPGCSFLFLNLICRIFQCLCDKKLYTTVPLELGSESESLLFSKVTALLEQNNGRINREYLSQELNYSGGYINRVVNKYTGMNVTQYAASFTMKRAAWLLLHSNATISDIALDLGYTNRTNFYKAFEKTYGETPRQYRVRNQTKPH